MAGYSQAARRYAKSLYDIASEKGNPEEVAADMKLIADTCEESRDLRLMLRSPIVKSDKKIQILNKIFAGEIGTISLRLINLVAQKKREKLIPAIALAYTELYREKRGILSAEITTAIPLSNRDRGLALEKIKKLSEKVELTEQVDPDIIGGYIIRVGDRQYDDSVSGRLAAMRRQLTQNTKI